MKTAFLFLVMVANTFNLARADSDYDAEQLQQLVKSKQLIPLEQLLLQHRDSLQGRIVDVELERENQRWVYEIKVLTERGRRREFYFDGTTGAPLSHEEEETHH